MIFYIDKEDAEALLLREENCVAVCLWATKPAGKSIAIDVKAADGKPFEERHLKTTRRRPSRERPSRERPWWRF